MKSWNDRVEGIRSDISFQLTDTTEIETKTKELEIEAKDDLGRPRQWHYFEIRITDQDSKRGASITFDSLSPDDAREIARQLTLQANRVEARERKNIENGNAHLNLFYMDTVPLEEEADTYAGL
jgi:hypothetical protein